MDKDNFIKLWKSKVMEMKSFFFSNKSMFLALCGLCDCLWCWCIYLYKYVIQTKVISDTVYKFKWALQAIVH